MKTWLIVSIVYCVLVTLQALYYRWQRGRDRKTLEALGEQILSEVRQAKNLLAMVKVDTNETKNSVRNLRAKINSRN